MGYISDVKICMKRKSYEELRKRVAEHEAFRYMFDKGFFELRELEDDKDVVVCSWDSIKWYSSFEEIGIIEDYLDELQDREIDFRFIRVGEEYNDIEYKEYYRDGSCDRIEVHQSIDIY